MQKKQMSNWTALKKVLKARMLVPLILLLMLNTFAWFIYATRVDNEMSAHVRAWDVLFEAGDSPIINYVNVDVESMYPGMEDFIYKINAYNKSEVDASLSYILLEARILSDQYTSVEGRRELGEDPVITDLTSQKLLEKLAKDYPFKITVSLTAEELDAQIGLAYYEIKVEWPFESGDDATDTEWGIKAANYKALNPNNASILLKIKISITQST